MSATARCARLFARTSAVVRAQLQAIVWHELLPALVGPARIAALPAYKGFDADADPSVSAEFAAASAFTWHAMLSDEVLALTPSFAARPAAGERAFAGRFQLRDAFFAPARALGGGLDPLLRGAWAQRAQPVGLRYCDSVRLSFLGDGSSGGGGGGGGFGLDLAALDIQRGRDLGVPSYIALRSALGLAPAPADHLARLAAPYGGNASDIDLLVGALAEPHVAGGAVGETTAAVLTEQLLRTRNGDRFWLGDARAETHPQLSRDLVAAGVSSGGRADGATLGALIARNSGVAGAGEVGAGSVLRARSTPKAAAKAPRKNT